MDISTLFHDRRIKISLIAILAIFIAYIGFLTWLDRVHRAQDEIEQYWALLERVSQERLALLPQFALLIQTQAPQSQSIAEALNTVYKQAKPIRFPETTLNDPNLLKNMATVERHIVAVLSQMESQLPPQISQSNQYQSLIKILESKELQIQFAIHALTKQIVFYNRLTYDLPQRWVNTILTHFPPKYFPEVPTLEGVRRPER